MKILVVGGAGYIGSICAELLLDQGHEIAIFDNLGEAIGAPSIGGRDSSTATCRIDKRSIPRWPQPNRRQ